MNKYLLSVILFLAIIGIYSSSVYAEADTVGYYTILAAELTPSTNTQEYEKNDLHLWATNDLGNNSFRAAVHLPDGARILELRAYVYDDNPSQTMLVHLFRAPLSDLTGYHVADCGSQGSSGWQESIDSIVSYSDVDNSIYVFCLTVHLRSGDDSHRFSYAQIKYRKPEVGIKEESSEKIYKPDIFQNYPNPMSSVTRIKYNLPERGKVILKIYNEAGQLVRTLVDEEREPGKYTALWDGRNSRGEKVANGSYFYLIETRSYTSSKKLIMLK